MAVKALPKKIQKKGKKIATLFAVIFGIIFGGALATFITLNSLSEFDQTLKLEESSASTLKDTGDGIIYTTENNLLFYCDYDGEVLSKTTLSDVFSSNGITDALGRFVSSTSLSYSSDTNELFLTAQFLDGGLYKNYLFKFTRNDNQFLYSASSNYTLVENPITAFTVHDNYLYAIIRKNVYCTISKFNTNDLSQPSESAYLFNKSIDENMVSYSLLQSLTIYDVHYLEQSNKSTIFILTNKGVVGINESKFADYPESRNNTEVDNNNTSELYSDYVYYIYSDSNNQPRGGFTIGNKCYIATKLNRMAVVDYASLDDEFPETELSEVYETDITSIHFSKSLPVNRQGIFYNKDAKKAVTISDETSLLTYIDVEDPNHPQIIFEDDAEINITDVVISPSCKKIFYLCQNSEVTKDQTRMLRVKNVDKVLERLSYTKYNPALLITSIISCFFFVIALLCAVKNLFLESLLLFFKNIKRNWFAYLFLLISLTLLGLFCYYPAAGSISMSFFSYKPNQPIVWNNFANYVEIFTNPRIYSSFIYMILFLATDIITAIIPPLIFAFFLTVMRNKKLSAVTRTLMFLPSVIPGVTKMLIWQTGIYGEYGIINRIIQLFNGNPVVFFNGSNFDPWALILMGFPYVGSYLVFYGALMNIPGSYYEAAELEGLDVWKRFTRIDIPLIRPQIKYVLILTVIASVQNFGRTYMITSSLFTIKTPIHIMYEYINSGDYGLSSAMATILFIMLLIFTIFNFRKQKEQLGDSI